MAVDNFGATMAGGRLGTFTEPAVARSAPANAGHRAIDTNAQAFHEGNRNLTSLAINLLDLLMDCSSEAAVLSMASTQ